MKGTKRKKVGYRHYERVDVDDVFRAKTTRLWLLVQMGPKGCGGAARSRLACVACLLGSGTPALGLSQLFSYSAVAHLYHLYHYYV